MFAGIVEGTAEVAGIEFITEGNSNEENAGAVIKIHAAFNASIGASVAINGVCLTVVSCQNGILAFEAISETLRKTNLGQLTTGAKVNVERSLQISDRIDGHFVSGHVDAAVCIIQKREEGTSILYECELPPHLRAFIAPKGSVTINGVALTVGPVSSNSFGFYIIPHTAAVTNLGMLQQGSTVNLEVDLLARYVVNACNLLSTKAQ